MPETKRRASLNFFQGADGPTLMFLMFEDADLSGLKALFLGLANGEWERLRRLAKRPGARRRRNPDE